MTQLEKDIKELADEVVTKKDLLAGLKIVGEIAGFGTVLYATFMAATVWLPGIGIPISTGMACVAMKHIVNIYPDLPTDQRRVVAKCVKFLTKIIL